MGKIKILHIATLQNGGAGIAAMRLHKALLAHGYDSRFLFLDTKKPTGTEARFRRKWYLWELMLRILKKLGLPLNLEQKNDYSIRKYKYNIEIFSFANTPYTTLHNHPLVKQSDVLHLHWIANFIDFATFFTNVSQPVVWTFHDMNPFQGGFHYKEDENRYGKQMQDINQKQLHLKEIALRSLPSGNLSVVTPSSWLGKLSKQSRLMHRFAHYHIANGVNTNIFEPQEQTKNAASDKRIHILFVSENLTSYRKGFDLTLEALQDETIGTSCRFTAVGFAKRSARLPNVQYTGSISSEETMSSLYNEADIFLLPSREDNLPNSMIESLCCGTPVVGFAIGGLAETIVDGENGYLSPDVTAAGLKAALLTCIANINKLNRGKIAANAKLQFSTDTQVKAMGALYKKCLHTHPAENAVA